MRYLKPAVLSSFVVFMACATSGAGGAGSAGGSTKTNTDFITTSEIEGATFRDAYDVVQRLRPSWLTRARASSGGSLGGTQVAGSSGSMAGVQPNVSGAGLVVYLDNARMGGPEALRDISASAINTLQYMDAATATAKLPGIGSSIVSGAIVVTSRTGH